MTEEGTRDRGSGTGEERRPLTEARRRGARGGEEGFGVMPGTIALIEWGCRILNVSKRFAGKPEQYQTSCAVSWESSMFFNVVINDRAIFR